MIQKRHGNGMAGMVAGICLLLVLLTCTGCMTADPPESGSDSTWRTMELTDVRSGTTFTVADLNDLPVLIQPFTLTCPVCTRQQAEIANLHATGDIPFLMIGLDIDPNGDEPSLRAYTGQHNSYGLYARSPTDMTRSLVGEFGMRILSPAQAPLVLVCPDGTARILSPGIRSSAELARVLREVCPS